MDTNTAVVANVSRTQKWGYGYTSMTEQVRTASGNNSHLAVAQVEQPSYTGTLRTVLRVLRSDRTLASFQSGGTCYRSQWFFDGRPIAAIAGWDSVGDAIRSIEWALEEGQPLEPIEITFKQ